VLYREHVCVEIGDPLLALLRHSKVTQGISDIRPDRLKAMSALPPKADIDLVHRDVRLVPKADIACPCTSQTTMPEVTTNDEPARGVSRVICGVLQ
jgi:hypothetical protein